MAQTQRGVATSQQNLVSKNELLPTPAVLGSLSVESLAGRQSQEQSCLPEAHEGTGTGISLES